MMKFLFAIFLAILILPGCSNLNLNTPPDSNEKHSLIPLPLPAEGTKIETRFTVSKTINGSAGGIITFDKTYLSLTKSLVTVHLDLTFPEGAFSGSKEITLILDDKFAVVECYPAMEFDKKLTMNFSYVGLDLSSLNLFGNVGFYFIGDDGSYEPVPNSGITLIRFLGKIGVKDAKISHFSRYGWAT